MAKDLAGDNCALRDLKDLSTADFWNWANSDGLDNYGDAYLGLDKCVDFKKDIWFKLGMGMRRKHHTVFQDHLKYIHNDIVKPLSCFRSR